MKNLSIINAKVYYAHYQRKSLQAISFYHLKKYIFRDLIFFLKTFGGNGIFSYFCGRIT